MSERLNDDPFKAETSGGDFLVVGLGASAGGITALRDFFANVPTDSGMSYVVILHLSPEHDSQLASILQRVAPIPVMQVVDEVRVEPNHVYVIPPNKSLAIADGRLMVSSVTSTEVRRAPVDIFFRTLAESHGARAVSVILSGTGANGSMGIKRIKEMGGICIVQDPQESEFSDMARHSLATGLVDYVLPAREIPAQIIAYREHLKRLGIPEAAPDQSEVETRALRDIFTHLRVRTGHDFSNYKRATVMRRIARRMGVHQLQTLAAYAEYMREQPQEANSLLKDLLISVTNFFRDREAFERLEQVVIPDLFEGKSIDDHVRVWAAGCATGEEAYSLTMMLIDYAAKLASPPQIQVFATDIDEKAIAVARDGYYTLNDIADVAPERLSRYFVREGDDGYRVRREIREHVLFAVHNVIKDPPFAHLNLVTCRNLLIYLNRTAQRRVLDVVHFALNPGGYVMLGASESLDGASDIFISVDKECRIFRARMVENRLVFPVPEGSIATRLVGKLPELRRTAERHVSPASYAQLHQKLLERYAPPSVVVNEEYDIVHMSESAGRFMELRGGELSANLLQLVRPDLRLELRAALYQAAHSRRDVDSRAVTVTLGGETKTIQMRVRPSLNDEDEVRGFLLVLFDEPASASPPEPASVMVVNAGEEQIARRLEEELLELKDQLNATMEQHELQREELKASNEELQAMNEEMRSAAEELETSKEELQSINEELTTVNQELKVKIEELSHTNDDLQNLMNSSQIGTVFLDRDLRVKFFTPLARDYFNLIPGDVGRPLSDITSKLDGDGLLEDAERVLDRLQLVEREVHAADGRSVLVNIAPYRTIEDRINGVVIALFDITERVHAEAALRESEERFRNLIEAHAQAVWETNAAGEVVADSPSWRAYTGQSFEEWIGYGWLDAVHPDERDYAGRQWREAIAEGRMVNAEFRLKSVEDGWRWTNVRATPVRAHDGSIIKWVGMNIDIHARVTAQTAMRESEEKYRTLFNSMDEGYAVVEVLADEKGAWNDFLFLEVNPAFEKQTGMRNAAGRTAAQILGAPNPHWAQIYGRVAETGEAIRFEESEATLSRIFDLYAFRLGGEGSRRVAVLFTDITRRKHMEEELRASEERTLRMVNGITDYAIITLDADGYIDTWNVGAERIFGYSSEDAVGQHTEIIFTREDLRHNQPAKEMQEARANGRAADERWHRRKDGSRIFLSGVLSPLGEGVGAGYVKIARDLTAQKRAEEDLRNAHDELEDKVRERTLELASVNESLRDEISERVRTERSRVRLLKQIVRAQEEERRRIALDIHDQLGQQMTALRLNLDSISQDYGADEEMRRRVEQVQALAERLDADVDFLAWELRPAALDDLGLLVATRNFVSEWSRHSGVVADFHTTGMDAERLSPEAESALYRITQEALNNIQKYARASRVDVLLERRDEHVILIVEDNGVGFSPQRETGDGGAGLGLVGMRERATLVGGTLEIESSPGEGTAVFARVPVNFLEEEAEE